MSMRKDTRNRMQVMVDLAIEGTERRGEPFRNPYVSPNPNGRRAYPLKYVKRHYRTRQREGRDAG